MSKGYFWSCDNCNHLEKFYEEQETVPEGWLELTFPHVDGEEHYQVCSKHCATQILQEKELEFN